MMQLCPFETDASWEVQVRQLTMHPHQQPFIGDLDALLQTQEPGISRHVMVQGNQVVGFFRLDAQFSASHPFAPEGALGLRSFFVGSHYQGQGLARHALQALPAYIRHLGLPASKLYLTVNCKNDAAYQLYQRCAFVATGELYLDGGYGPQHIMYLALAAPAPAPAPAL